jgi:pimeloyl-ACP methyl ester carboxylesterase
MAIDETRLTEGLREISDAEHARLAAFLESHRLQRLDVGTTAIAYYLCGTGDRTVLIHAGGWGGPQMLYDTIIGLEERFRVVVIDVSPFDDPDTMSEAVNRVLDHEGIDRVLVLGQSLSGILGQIYLRRNLERVDAVILINTIAPRIERCRKWVLTTFRLLPFPILKALAARTMGRLSSFESEVPSDAVERVAFRTAFAKRMTSLYMTRRIMINLLTMAYAFNERDSVGSGGLEGWPGRALIITSRDDAGYLDVELLDSRLPDAEVFELPTGFRHVAPMIYRDELFAEIHSFLENLDTA